MKFFFTLFFLLLSSCALFSSQDKSLNYSYISGENLPVLNTEQILNKLKKEEKMAGGAYKITTWPITKPLVQAEIRENELNPSLPNDLIVKELEQKYLDQKTCFKFNFRINKYEKMIDLSEWKIFLTNGQSDDTLIPLLWTVQDKQAAISNYNTYHGKGKQWLKEAVACTERPVKLDYEFSLILTPSFVPWPFPESLTISWLIDKVKEIDGKKVNIPTENRRKDRYRGW